LCRTSSGAFPRSAPLPITSAQHAGISGDIV
jgi:hypothetical protein